MPPLLSSDDLPEGAGVSFRLTFDCVEGLASGSLSTGLHVLQVAEYIRACIVLYVITLLHTDSQQLVWLFGPMPQNQSWLSALIAISMHSSFDFSLDRSCSPAIPSHSSLSFAWSISFTTERASFSSRVAGDTEVDTGLR